MKTAITTKKDFMNSFMDTLCRETYSYKTKGEIISYIKNQIETMAMIRLYSDFELWENYDNEDAYKCAVEIYNYMNIELDWF